MPAPATISAEGRARLTNPPPSILSGGASVAEQRARIEARQAKDAEAWLQRYPATIMDTTVAGVPVCIVTPRQTDATKAGRVLINLHGGAFRVDAGSLLESIPIAGLTATRVIAVRYRLAPEHPFPAAVDDAVAVYQELLKEHRPGDIGIYGTSAGAILTVEVAMRIKGLGLPMPAVLGIFSAWGDFSRPGDSLALFGLQGLAGTLLPSGPGPLLPDYVGATEPTDPVLSPLLGDLRGLPPTLFVTSTRDLLLSGTVMLHLAFLRAGNDARLVVFEALPHAFWLDALLPESHTANELMARFLDNHLGLPVTADNATKAR